MENIIYHYCDTDAFKAIIQNKTLWLSSVYNLNDYKEIHWIKDKVKKKIEELKTKDNFAKYTAFEKLYTKQLPNVYIASFSQGGDLLSQWRAYANDGFGLAIGFNANYFKQNILVNTTEVLYDESLQEEQIQSIIKPLENIPDNIDFQDESFKEICRDIIIGINNLSAKSKNELFKEEKEVRLVHSPVIIKDKENQEYIFKNNISSMKFRTNCANLIPYFELKFDEEVENIPPILEIVRGPKNKFIKEELKLFLSINGLYGIDIKNSKSSYR